MAQSFSKLRFNEFAKTAAVCGAVALSATSAMATAVNVGSGTGRVTVNAGNAVWHLNNNITFSTTSSNWGVSEAELHAGGITRNDAFDGALSWHVNLGTPGIGSAGGYRSPSGTIDISPYPITSSVGTTITGAPQTLAGLTVTGQVYFSPVKAVVRSMLILKNPTGAPITVSVDIDSNLGSDVNTVYKATSSGDAIYGATDNWLVSCQRDSVVPANCTSTLDPILTYAYTATGAAVRPTTLATVGDGSDRQFFRYTVTVPAGLTRRVMVFEQMSDTSTNAITDAALFSSNTSLQGTDYLTGLSSSDQSEIVNWVLSPVTVAVAGDPIPPLTAAPPVPGIGNQPGALDLSSGKGPDLLQCLMTTVRGLLGADAQYLGQGSDGVAKISLAGGRQIAFYPLKASMDLSQSADIHLTGSNILTLGSSCGNLTIAPALGSLSSFGPILDGMGLRANINAQGVMVITVGNTVYVARPDYAITTGGASSAGIAIGFDGIYRFTDSTGHVQVLRPAFGDTDSLPGAAMTALGLGGASVTIQTDGTATLTALNGQQYVLTPDLTLTQVSAANGANLVWQDAANHYQYRASTLLGLSQGFTVRPL